MSDKGLSLQFILKGCTVPGQEIYITGAVNELGNWDKCKCPKLNTTPSSYPLWESDFIKFNNKYTNLEYKFFIRKECDKGRCDHKCRETFYCHLICKWQGSRLKRFRTNLLR